MLHALLAEVMAVRRIVAQMLVEESALELDALHRLLGRLLPWAVEEDGPSRRMNCTSGGGRDLGCNLEQQCVPKGDIRNNEQGLINDHKP